MNDMIQTGFDYAALPVESIDRLKTWKTEIAAFTDTVESSLVQIGLRFQKAQDELNRQGVKGEGFAAWVKTETVYSLSSAYRLIDVASEYKDKPLPNLRRSVLYAITAQSTPQEVKDKALEKGEGTTLADVKQWKEAALVASQRAEEFRQESNERRKKVRELEEQIDLLTIRDRMMQGRLEKAEEEINHLATVVPEQEKVIVAPDDYETIKAEAAKLRQQLDDIEARKDQLVQQQVIAKLKERGQEIAALEHQAEQLKGTITSYQAHIAKVHLPELEMQQQLKAVEDFMRACAGLAASLALFEHAPNPATTSVWQKGIAAATDAAQAMRMHTDRRPELTVIRGEAA